MRTGILAEKKLWFEYEDYQQYERFLNLSEKEKDIIEQFKKDGYYLYKNAIDEQDIYNINIAIDQWVTQHKPALMSNRKPDGTYPRLIALHEEVPAIQELFLNEATLRLQDLLFGCRSSLYTSITFLQGSQQALHRDIPVHNISPENLYFRIWFALEDTNSENGALTGVRGGHRVAIEKYKMTQTFYRRFDEIPEQDPLSWRKYQKELKKRYNEAGLLEEEFELSKGDLLIWHPLFPHGGSIIKDKNSSRRSVVLHVSVIPHSEATKTRI